MQKKILYIKKNTSHWLKVFKGVLRSETIVGDIGPTPFRRLIDSLSRQDQLILPSIGHLPYKLTTLRQTLYRYQDFLKLMKFKGLLVTFYKSGRDGDQMLAFIKDCLDTFSDSEQDSEIKSQRPVGQPPKKTKRKIK